jgi:hypothetical protein
MAVRFIWSDKSLAFMGLVTPPKTRLRGVGSPLGRAFCHRVTAPPIPKLYSTKIKDLILGLGQELTQELALVIKLLGKTGRQTCS